MTEACDRDGNPSHLEKWAQTATSQTTVSTLSLWVLPCRAGLVTKCHLPGRGDTGHKDSPGCLLCAEPPGVLSIETLTVKLAAFVRKRTWHGRSLLKGLSGRKGRWS